MALLDVRNLSTSFHMRSGIVRAAQNVDLTLERGETLGIVGESGSGKSVTCYSIMRLIRQPPGKIESGEVWYDGQDLLTLSEDEMRKIRGKKISMIFQDPMTSLNPYLRISTQMIEAIQVHEDIDDKAALHRAITALEEVGIPDASKRVLNHPHEFSGGMRQRVMIAMGLINDPDLLIADEPTTALDVTVQAQVLDIIKERQERLGTAVILVTHDLGVVAGTCDKVQVMYRGETVETGPTDQIFYKPQHAYTRALHRATPSLQSKGERLYTFSDDPDKIFSETEAAQSGQAPDGATDQAGGPIAVKSEEDRREDFLVLDKVSKYFELGHHFFSRKSKGVFKAVNDVSLTVREGEILGIVGESGCGKTTLSRAIMQLQRPTSGDIFLEGKKLSALSDADVRAERINFQMIFQDPYASLNPRLTVYSTLSEAIRTRHPDLKGDDLRERVIALMRKCGLSPSQMNRYPHEFSGGQRQRVAIARALAPEPKLVIADEPVSALDVSIQSQILNLLKELSTEMNLTMIFISHDLSVVRYIADRIAVMYRGQIIELGSAEAIVDDPRHIYTKALMSAIPVPDPRTERSRERILLEDEPGGAPQEDAATAENDGLEEVVPGHFVSARSFDRRIKTA